MLGAYADELLWVLGLFVAVVIVAAMVNRFRPMLRPRLRRLVTVFALFTAATGLGVGFRAAGLASWGNGCLVAAEILQAFTLISLSATLVIGLALPVVGVELPMIASDLLVGLGYLVVALVVLARHGVDPTGALVSGAVVSAVLAISLQSTLGNVVGGVALQLDGSVREGDWIQLENGKQGRVRSVRWRHTVIETRDWSTIVVPNAQLLATSITLLGRRDGKPVPQRMWVWFNVDYRFAPSRVIQVVTDALCAAPIDNVVDDPRPSVVCMDFTRDMRESVATYAARYWIHDVAADDPTSSRVRARIYTALQRAQIPLAVPAQTAFVELKDEARTQRRIERQLDEHFAALKTVHLFRSLTDDELRTLAAGMHHVMYTAGEIITRQGATAHWLYVMTSGAAEIRTTVDPDGPGGLPEQGVVVAQIAAPDFFGEMSLMTGAPRSADVVAISDVDCFRLGRDTFKTVLLARPEIATELSSKLASRRVELIAAREGLDATSKQAREASERERILHAIRSFFALDP
ncbi:MAG TPA: mechanosensitive ion channel family protein [Kofleriaceae bacterium]|jgi:small-conductance mechanosensitive channel/CRP-like cAMP-binding protein